MKFLPCLALLLLTASPAFANAHLIKSSPANGAKVRSPSRILLTFSEALEPAFSGALLLDEDGRNWTGDPVKIDGPTMRLSPGGLPPGAYIVSWHSAGHEGRRLDGRVHFFVRP
jgi:methionine-rich copper-binding protein CopC